MPKENAVAWTESQALSLLDILNICELCTSLSAPQEMFLIPTKWLEPVQFIQSLTWRVFNVVLLLSKHIEYFQLLQEIRNKKYDSK